MSGDLPRVVLDTVVFVQCLISGRGPSAACLERLRAGKFVLLISDATLAELKDVPLRPKFTAKYPYVTPEKVSAFVAEIENLAVRIAAPLTAFKLPRDPADEPFIDLAAAGDARFIVTWNERHLTYLMRADTAEGREFRQRFPQILIVSPPEFLRQIEVARDVPDHHG